MTPLKDGLLKCEALLIADTVTSFFREEPPRPERQGAMGRRVIFIVALAKDCTYAAA
jgi:hypothetical protein